MLFYNRQVRRNPPAFQMGPVPPPDATEPPLMVQEVGTPQRLLFAAMAAYWVVAAVPPADEPCAFGYQDTQVRQPLRAESSGYRINARFVESETTGATNGHQTHQVRIAPRAANSAYWLDQRDTALIDTGVPASQAVQDHKPRYAPRATTQAYFIEQRAIWLELGLPAAQGHQDQKPRPAPRAAKSAYDFINRLPSDNQPVAWGHQTAQAKAAQRAPAAAYWVDHVALIQGPDKPASDGQQANNVRSVARATNDAYRLIVPMVRDEPETSSGYIEHRPLVVQRAPKSAYWLEQRAAIADPGRPVAFGHVTDRAPAAKRAAASAYSVLQGVPAIEVPAAKGYIETASLPAQRAKAGAYFVSLPMKAIEVGIPAQFGHQSLAAKPAERAANAAYAIAAAVATPEPQSPGAVVLPIVVRGAPRAAHTAYRWEIFSQTDEQPPAGRGHITERVRAAQRAEASAYQQQFGPQVAENALIYGYVDQTARSAKRATTAAYWIDSSTHILGLDIPAGTGFITHAVKQPQRAASEAYRASVSQPQQADFMLPARGFQQERARAIGRASHSAYLIANAPIPAVPPTPAQPLLPHKASPTNRASQAAYAALLSPMSLQEPSVYGFQSQPIPPLRAARSAYWIAASFPPAEVPPARGYIEPIARQSRRSANTAFWLPQRFQIVGADQPASWGYQEWRHLRTQRASRSAYAVNVQFANAEIIRTGPLEQIYGASNDLASIIGANSSIAGVYGRAPGITRVRGAT